MSDDSKTAVVVNDGFLYYGSFYKCCINLPKGQKWNIIHTGGNITVLSRKDKLTIEIATEDFGRHFKILEQEDNEQEKKD